MYNDKKKEILKNFFFVDYLKKGYFMCTQSNVKLTP